MNEERGIRSEERGIAAIFATSATSGKVQCGVLSGSITHAVYNTIYLSHRHQGSNQGSNPNPTLFTFRIVTKVQCGGHGSCADPSSFRFVRRSSLLLHRLGRGGGRGGLEEEESDVLC